MKKLLMLLMLLVVVGCTEENTNGDTPKPIDVKTATIEFSPYGNKSFAVVSVTISENKVANATINEYTFFEYDSYENIECVPNANDAQGLGGNYDSTKTCLGSKRVNDEEYSAKMEENADATQSWVDSITAIEEYAKDKTLEELKAFNKDTDTITGSTLAGSNGYLEAIIAAVEAAE